jgi:prepilin-type N-terminal cleavage/methylation domain-containing protein
MRTWPGLKPSSTGHGFTLVELILTVALLALLLGASVFNFSSLQRGAVLEEGAGQVEGLFRFARAYAAQSGRLVQITFDFDSATNDLPIQLMCETDPLTNPGLFSAVPAAEAYARQILQSVNFLNVQSTGPLPTALVEASTNAPSSVVFPEEDEAEFEFGFRPIRFFPDGSSDSAEVILTSKEPEDVRRISIKLNGLIGLSRRAFLTNSFEPGSTNQVPSTEEMDDFEF